MKRELGIAKCGLACCLCSENVTCKGCGADACANDCENLRCVMEKGYTHCYACPQDCHKGLLAKCKPYGFTTFIKRYGEEKLLDCLAENEKKGIVYHRTGILGDYDNYDDVETLIQFILAGV